MSASSKIEWTDATWNPVRGCSHVSGGCRNCYAERFAARRWDWEYGGLVQHDGYRWRWNGKVFFVETVLDRPLRWRRPRRVFVNSMSDLFHEKVRDEWIARILNTIYETPRHTYQILTKRPRRMRDFFIGSSGMGASAPPIPNLWLGVSVENQAAADERIPLLLHTPAAVRFISAEPLLGPVDLRRLAIRPGKTNYLINALSCDYHDGAGTVIAGPPSGVGPLDWVIAGGETGPGARPMSLDWARALRDQCVAAGVPFFYKGALVGRKKDLLLDGREWREWPRVGAGGSVG